MFTIKELILLSIILAYTILYSIFKKKKGLIKFFLYIITIGLFVIIGSISFSATLSYKFDHFYNMSSEITEPIELDGYSVILAKKTKKDKTNTEIITYEPNIYKKYWLFYTKNNDLEVVSFIDYENKNVLYGYMLTTKKEVFIYIPQTIETVSVDNQPITLINHESYTYFSFSSSIVVKNIVIDSLNYSISKGNIK
ncbi:hypothetical protein BN85409400 [Alteracholeplasma palmae J233]|uniref:Uncharacterized protein n=1 Tax=Alteracholeplasma palmae (strain ATCC 49389 / J233) TaxID=1318466 RepID=U4KL68_ALTPJ|nr:hypothetical protein [Alteracholeplasma palmae]CCV64517.1 hypothetical protein BN85409400 [Alteracholeplasma palmae J233]